MKTAVLWFALLVLALIGVAGGVYRAAFVSDAGARAEPVRDWTLGRLGIVDPLRTQRVAEVERFDGTYAAHPLATWMHVIPGALLLGLAPLQFWSRIRERHPRFHRVLGRVLVIASLFVGGSALYLGLLYPFGGIGESSAIALFGGIFLIAIGRAFVAIRQRRVQLHREWMLRAMSIAFAISTIRLLGLAGDLALTPYAVGPREVFLGSIWSGWIGMLAAAEVWIRSARRTYGTIAVSHASSRDVRNASRSHRARDRACVS